jgi:hypothetical protein
LLLLLHLCLGHLQGALNSAGIEGSRLTMFILPNAGLQDTPCPAAAVNSADSV